VIHPGGSRKGADEIQNCYYTQQEEKREESHLSKEINHSKALLHLCVWGSADVLLPLNNADI